MTIATRLLVLLVVPLAALVAVGVFTGVQLNGIEAHSRLVAESRISALATLGNLSRSFAELRVNVRSQMLATTGARRAEARARFDQDEREVHRLLEKYADSYVLSDKEQRLLGEFQYLSREYTAGARQVMRLTDDGRGQEAIALFESTILPVGVRLSGISNDWIAYVEQAANGAGDASILGIQRFERRVLIFTVSALLLTALLGTLTLRRIVTPIRGLETAVDAIAAGDYAKAVPFVDAADEMGGLARSVEVLKRGAALMDEQRWVKSNVSTVTGALQGAASLPEFGQRVLSALVPILGGGVGAFYVFDEAAGELRRLAAYGLAGGAEDANALRPGEGLVGQCAI